MYGRNRARESRGYYAYERFGIAESDLHGAPVGAYLPPKKPDRADILAARVARLEADVDELVRAVVALEQGAGRG